MRCHHRVLPLGPQVIDRQRFHRDWAAMRARAAVQQRSLASSMYRFNPSPNAKEDSAPSSGTEAGQEETPRAGQVLSFPTPLQPCAVRCDHLHPVAVRSRTAATTTSRRLLSGSDG